MKIDTLLESIEQILENIQNQTEIPKEDWITTLNNVTDLISQSLEINETVNAEQSQTLTKLSVDVLDILINQPVLEKLSIKEQVRSSSAILGSVEHLSVLLNIKQDENFNYKGNLSNIELQTKRVTVENNSLIFFDFKDFTIELNSTSLNYTYDKIITSTATTIRKLSDYISEEENVLVYSQILSLVIGDETKNVNLSDGQFVKFKTPFRDGKKLYFGAKVRCSYWDFENLAWSQTGCNNFEDESNRKSSTCTCNHTTNFAVLIDVNNQELNEGPKNILSYVSSSFTILCSACAIYILFKKSNRNSFDFTKKRLKDKSNRAKINLHIAFWLIASHLLVVLTLDQDGIIYSHFKNDSLNDSRHAFKYENWEMFYCSASSLLLLYCLLTTFSVMLLINYHLYKSIAKPISRFHFKKYLIAVYLYPLIIVLGSVFYIYLIELAQDELNNLFDDDLYFDKIWNFLPRFFNFTDTNKWKRTAKSLYGDYL